MAREHARNAQNGRRRVRRIGFIGVAASCAAAVLVGRLAYLQLGPLAWDGGMHIASMAVGQRHDTLVLDTGRGFFYDRHGISLTGEPYAALAAFPMAERRGTDRRLERLASAVGVQAGQLGRWLDELKAPAFWLDPSGRAPLRLEPDAAAEAEAAGVPGVYVLPYTPRDASLHAAEHAIGYVGQHPEFLAKLYAEETARGKLPLDTLVGGSGLELSLERLLRGNGPVSAYHLRSARGGVEPAADSLRIARDNRNPYYPLAVYTTLDSRLQERLASLADDAGMKDGAIVVLDASNADVLAMVSRPAFDPLHPGIRMEDTVNRALRAAVPGSIFKLVTEAAALEAGAAHLHEQFHCDGEYGRYGLSCWKKGGHGTITLEEALADSCNVAFAIVAERLTPDQLQTTAERLGFGRQVGWTGSIVRGTEALRPLGAEEAGRVFEGRSAAGDGGLMAQTGIGQRDAAVTPLQAANAVVTLLHAGEVQAPRIVKEIRYATGERMTALPPQISPSSFGRVSPRTAHALLDGMRAVVTDGTGRALRSAVWPLAGKSGTAQAEHGGRSVNHQWFVGYGPVHHPRYAVAVLATNRPVDSSHLAMTLFGRTMDALAQYEKGSATVR